MGGFHVVRLHLDVAEAAGRTAGSARSRHSPVRRRGRGPHGRGAARRRGGQRQADLQLSQRHAGNGGGGLSDPAAPRGDAGRRTLFELRCRPRLPVPVQLLHHHQRAGPQIALPHARRRRGHRAGERGAEHHAVLHHRRQFRPQPQLGADPRPADRIARDATNSTSGCCCRSTRFATASRISSRRQRAPAAPQSSWAWKTSIRNP